jgi:hypothetical protein
MSDGGGQQTQTKDPWGPAQKPLQNTLNTGQALETYYQQNPFNPLQQAGYQNLASDLDNFRNTMAPQAQAFNNRLMNTNYQRAPAGSELGGGYRPVDSSQFLPPEQRQAYGQMGQGGVQSGGGLMSAMSGMQGMSAPSSNSSAMSLLQALGQGGQGLQTKPMQMGLLSQPQQGMSVVAPNSQNYGLLNWSELNPYTATNGIPKTPAVDPNAKTPEETAMEEAARRERERQQNYGGS